MATYFILETFTREGVTSVREAPGRSDGVITTAQRMGVTVLEWFYVIGPFDYIMKAEAPDEETIAAFVMLINAGGNVTAKYFKAFTPEEWKGIVARLP